MALSEAEELELLELEEAEAASGGTNTPGAPQTGLDKAVAASNKVNNAVSTLFKPVGMAVGAIKEGSDALADKLAESGHPILGLQAAGPSMAIEGLGKGMELLDKAGEKTAEFGGRMGFPKTGAAVGTAISMAPDLAAGAGAIAKRALIAEGLKAGGRKIMSPARFAKDLVTKPSAAEATQIGKESLRSISERGGEKLALARETKEAAKKGLIEAEEKAGLHFESTPGFESLLKDPKKMSEFTQKIGRLAKQTPEALAQSVPSEQLQLFRKIAQEGEKVSGLSDIANSQLRHGKDVFTRALGIKEKGMGEALGKYRDAGKVVDEIPGEIKERLLKQKTANERAVLSAKSLDKKRKVIKGLAKGVAGYLAAKSIFK